MKHAKKEGRELKNKRKREYRKLSDSDKSFIEEHYEDHSNKWIGKKLNRDRNVILSYGKKLGLIKKITKRNGDLSVLLDQSYESYYWLGLFVADGHITKDGRFCISQRHKDSHQIIKLSKYLNTSYTISKKQDYCIRLLHKSPALEIVKLFNIDFKKTKTFSNIDITHIKDINCLRCFFAGFIDGDGHINERQYIEIQCSNTYFNLFKYITRNIVELDSFSLKEFSKKDRANTYLRLRVGKTSSLKLHKEIERLNIPKNHRKWSNLE